jgi:hypothetical protein
MVFPLVGLFHILWAAQTAWTMRDLPMGIDWLPVLWMVAFTICWLAACDLKKWGALGYIGLIMAELVLYLVLKTQAERDVYLSTLFLIDIAFGIIILVYYKRFGEKVS